MTIKIIERPERGYAWEHIDTHVTAVSEWEITYNDGSTNHKNFFAKVEVLSQMDEPDEWAEVADFYKSLGIESGHSKYRRMTDQEFEALSLPNHL